MENYQEQYKQELHQQEIRSNLQTLKGFFWIFATILMIWVLTLLRIFIVDAGIFTMAVGMSVVIGIPIVYIYKKVDLSKQWVKYVFLTLICMISAIFATFLSFSRSSYLCAAVAFGSAVPTEEESVDHVFRE